MQISSKKFLMKDKFKVIHVITSPCAGGAELLVRELTKRTNKLGINCKAVYFNNWAECAKTIRLSENEEHLNISYQSPFAIIKLRKFLKSELVENPSLIVHAHLTWPMFFVPLACIGLAVKLVFTEHSPTNKRRNIFFFNHLEKLFYNRYNSIIAITDGVKKSLLNWIGFSISGKLTKIYNGARFFTYKERKKMGNRIKFLSIGSLTTQKGFDNAIKALSKLQGINWQYEIVGYGPLRSDLEKLIISLNLKDKVVLSGWCTNLEEKYHNSDIQLIPSRWEGFGLVAVEGMSTGLPVIASDLKGINEVVSSTVDSCFLVKNSDNIVEWVDQIKLCINALEKDLVHISKQSYLHSKKFSLEKMTKNYIDLYRQVLNDG